MQIIIQTQYRENYGAHAWDGKWPMKYFVFLSLITGLAYVSMDADYNFYKRAGSLRIIGLASLALPYSKISQRRE